MPDALENPAMKSDFANMIVNPEAALASAVEWINDNMEPAEVFDDAKMIAWAVARGWIAPTEE